MLIKQLVSLFKNPYIPYHEQQVEFFSALQTENEYLKTLLLKKHQKKYFQMGEEIPEKDIDDCLQQMLSTYESGPINPLTCYLEQDINYYLHQILSKHELQICDKLAMELPKFATKPYNEIEHIYLNLLKYFDPDNLPPTKKKNSLLDISQHSNHNDNKFFGNQKIFIIALFHHAIARYLNTQSNEKNDHDKHWNRCLLFLDGIKIIQLLQNHYLGSGRKNCFTLIHNRLQYFLLKESAQLNNVQLKNLPTYSGQNNPFTSTNYKGNTIRIINNLRGFTQGYITCHCPYYEKNFNRNGQTYLDDNFDKIPQQCRQTCVPCIFNHKLWPSLCTCLSPNEFRFIFSLPVDRRKMQNYLDPKQTDLSIPIELLKALEENTGIPSFCIDGNFPNSQNPTPLSIKKREYEQTFIATDQLYPPCTLLGDPIWERDCLDFYLQSIYEKEHLTVPELIKKIEHITILDENNTPMINYDAFFVTLYPPENNPEYPVTSSPNHKIPTKKYENQTSISPNSYNITEDKYLKNFLHNSATWYKEPEIVWRNIIPITTIEQCFVNLKPRYYDGTIFTKFKNRLQIKYQTLGKQKFQNKIKTYDPNITKEGFDVVLKKFAMGIINDEYNFCFIRIFDFLCQIFDIHMDQKN